MNIIKGKNVGPAIFPGDAVVLSTIDHRWWKRLLYFITFRKPPMLVEKLKIKDTSLCGNYITLIEKLEK